MQWKFRRRKGGMAKGGQKGRHPHLAIGIVLMLGAGAVAGAYLSRGPAPYRSAQARPAALTASDHDLTLTKTPSSQTFSQAGQTIQYTFTIHNPGPDEATGVYVEDSTGATCPVSGTLKITAGSTVQCAISYTTTAADVAAGQIHDTATVHADGNVGGAQSDATVTLSPGPAVGLAVVAGTGGFSQAGQSVTYDYTVTNPGDEPLANVSVSDEVNGSSLDVSCPGGNTLGVGAQTLTCSATHVTTPADVGSGQVVNDATVTADAPDGQQVTSTATHTVPLVQGGDVDLSVVAEPTSFADAGQEISYQYTVTNTGSVPLTGIDVSDTVNGQQPLDVGCDGDSLTAGSAPLDCEATYATTQADLSGGQVVNNATVTTDQGATAQASQVVTRNDIPNVSIVKRASADSFDRAGTEITYTYDVVNDGNTPLTDVGVTDSRGLRVNCGAVSTLEPAGSLGCLATYRTTAADVAAGQISSTATVRARTAAGRSLANTTSLVIPLRHRPGVSILKTASTGDFSQAGARVTYFYEVTNTGNVPLHSVTVTDNRLGPLSCPRAELAPGEHMICAAAHVITAADIARGSLGNAATVSGITPGGHRVTRSAEHVLPDSRLPAPVIPLLPEVAVTG